MNITVQFIADFCCYYPTWDEGKVTCLVRMCSFHVERFNLRYSKTLVWKKVKSASLNRSNSGHRSPAKHNWEYLNNKLTLLGHVNQMKFWLSVFTWVIWRVELCVMIRCLGCYFSFFFVFIVYLNVFMHKFLKDIKLVKGICRFDHPPNDGKHFFSLMKQKGVNKGGQFKLNVS